MKNHRLPEAVLYMELQYGKHEVGGQYMQYKDVIKRHLSDCSIPVEDWERLLLDRPKWRRRIKVETNKFELHLDGRRHLGEIQPKPRYNYTRNENGQFCCVACYRTFWAKFDFTSHIRAAGEAMALSSADALKSISSIRRLINLKCAYVYHSYLCIISCKKKREKKGVFLKFLYFFSELSI